MWLVAVFEYPLLLPKLFSAGSVVGCGLLVGDKISHRIVKARQPHTVGSTL